VSKFGKKKLANLDSLSFASLGFGKQHFVVLPAKHVPYAGGCFRQIPNLLAQGTGSLRKRLMRLAVPEAGSKEAARRQTVEVTTPDRDDYIAERWSAVALRRFAAVFRDIGVEDIPVQVNRHRISRADVEVKSACLIDLTAREACIAVIARRQMHPFGHGPTTGAMKDDSDINRLSAIVLK
jgi:hypothetical protein